MSKCTQHYPEYFRHKSSFYTIEIDPAKSDRGAPGHHITDSIENIGNYFKEGTFDCVLMNGVYGWGLNDEPTLLRSLSAVLRVLKKSGVLLWGWDKSPKYDPLNLDGKPYFRDFEKYEIGGAARIELDNKHHHIYDLYRKP